MESHFATEAVAQLRRRSLRAAAVNLIGPLTMLGGVAWAFLQPDRLTILHPHGQGFWWLLSEPPLYVILVGLGFALLLAPALLEDLEEVEDAPQG
jgi:NAD(P)H-flavin reductase